MPAFHSLSPEFPLLGMLWQSPGHGYELHQRLQAELGWGWRIQQNQIYNLLNRLEAQGYIAGEIHASGTNPARRSYHLTDSGRQRLESWLRQPSGCSIRDIRVEFLTRLYFLCTYQPELTHLIIEQQCLELKRCIERLPQQTSSTSEKPGFKQLSLDLRISQLTNLLEWLERHVETLEAAGFSGERLTNSSQQ